MGVGIINHFLPVAMPLNPRNLAVPGVFLFGVCNEQPAPTSVAVPHIQGRTVQATATTATRLRGRSFLNQGRTQAAFFFGAVMNKFQATINDGFPVLIEYEIDSTGDISEITVTSHATGQELNDLIYGTFVWDEAWNAAERHWLYQPITKQQLRSQRLNRLAQTFDTPFQEAA